MEFGFLIITVDVRVGFEEHKILVENQKDSIKACPLHD